QDFSIDQNTPFVKSNRFAGHRYDPFQEHDAGSRESNAHDVPPPGLMEKISLPIEEIDPVLLIGGQHAAALDPNGQQDKFENNETAHHQNENANEGALWLAANQHSTDP